MIDAPGASRRARVVLLRNAATASSEADLLQSSGDEPCSSLGDVQAVKAGEFLMDTRIDALLVAPAERCIHTAGAVAKCQSLTGDRAPLSQVRRCAPVQPRVLVRKALSNHAYRILCAVSVAATVVPRVRPSLALLAHGSRARVH